MGWWCADIERESDQCSSEYRRCRARADDLEKKNQKCTESLKLRDTEHANKLTGLRNQHRQELSQRDTDHAATLTDLRNQHRQELSNRDKQHADILTRTNNQHRQELSQRDKQHADDLTRANNQHQEELSQRDKQHAATLTDLRNQHRQELSKRDKQHADDLTRANNQHQEELSNRDEQHAATLTDLRNQHQEELSKRDKQHADNFTRTNYQHQEELSNRDEQHAANLTDLRNQQRLEVSSLHAKLAAEKEELDRLWEHKTQQDAELSQCAKITQNMLDGDEDFDSYHGLLDITDLTRETMEWPLYLHEDKGLALWQREHNATVVCIAGKFNAGKSHLVSKIYGKSFPSGDDVPTMGISFAFLEHPGTGWKDLVLDSAGARAPIGSVSREMHEKLVEDIQTDLCFQAADISVMVVNEMSQNDQDQMHALGHDRSLQSIIDRGASLVVVHNFRGAHNAEGLGGYWQRFVRNAFPDLVEKPCLGNQLTYGDSTLEAAGGSGEMRVRHLALANEHSKYGRGHNALVYQALRDWIVDQKRAGGAWRPAERLLQPLRELLPAKYLHAGEAPRIEFRDASPAETFPHFCRGFDTCKRVSGKLGLSQVLRTSWPDGVTPGYKLGHTREGYRTTMRKMIFNETVERERWCAEDRSECHVVLVLPGCAPSVEVTKMSGGIEAFVQCCRTTELYAGITSDKFMQGCFSDKVEVDLKTHVFVEHSYKNGILDLRFVSRDRAAGMRGLAWSDGLMLLLALPLVPAGRQLRQLMRLFLQGKSVRKSRAA